MLTATGIYTNGNLTEIGRVIVNNLTEIGEYAPVAVASGANDLIMSGGSVFGGTLVISTGCYKQLSGGGITGGSLAMHSGYAFTAKAGIVFGGSHHLPYNDYCATIMGGGFGFNTVLCRTTTIGAVVGGNMIKYQIPFGVSPAVDHTFTLLDASLLFKLEQQP